MQFYFVEIHVYNILHNGYNMRIYIIFIKNVQFIGIICIFCICSYIVNAHEYDDDEDESTLHIV